MGYKKNGFKPNLKNMGFLYPVFNPFQEKVCFKNQFLPPSQNMGLENQFLYKFVLGS